MGKYKWYRSDDLTITLEEIYVYILLLLIETLFNPVGVAVNGVVVKRLLHSFQPFEKDCQS